MTDSADGASRLLRLGGLAQVLGAEPVAEEALELAARVSEGRFYVACIGQFKRGKSTLLNALVGYEVVPTGFVPVTAVPTVIRFGDELHTRVRIRNGSWLDVVMTDLKEYVTWLWVALDAETRLIPAWHVGTRGIGDANWFVSDIASRLKNRVQLTSDGHRPYLTAVENAFGCEIDYGMLIKLYGTQPSGKYSPATCIGTRKRRIMGNPNRDLISTSYVERSNMTWRMTNRRFTRLTNAFSKKVENHKHMIALSMVHYNFCRIHQTLRVTPAMEAGIADHVWSLEELAGLIVEPVCLAA